MSVEVGVYSVGGEAALVADVGAVSALDWSHELDTFGEATVTLPRCSDRLLNVHPFTHELRITDDGELAFAGPVRYAPMPLHETGELQIIAQDVAYWLAVRFVHVMFDYTGTNTTIDQIVFDLVFNALSVLDPNLLPWLNVMACATIHERKSRSVDDPVWRLHLETIVGKLMHMSVHGRRLNFWCVNECLAQLPPASIEQFIEFPTLVRDGDHFTTHAAVFGDEATNIVGDAGGIHPDWPVLVERMIEEKSYLDVPSADVAASAMVTDRALMGSADRGEFVATVDCDAPWRFTALAPGMCAAVATPYGILNLRISKLSGSVQDGAVTRQIGFKEVG